jgi:hypothetical protein
MIKVAMVNANGEVVSIISPSTDSAYYNNHMYGDLLAVHIPHTSDNVEVLSTWVYDNGQWSTRTARPGEYYVWENMQWNFDSARFMELLRNERDVLLAKSDWTQMPDSPLTATQKTAWATYRQELRDLPQNVGEITSLEDVVWPIPPN